MTRTQLILCATAFSAVVFLPGVNSRAADPPVGNGRSVAPQVRQAPGAGRPVKALQIASHPRAAE